LLVAKRIENGKYPLVLSNGFGAVLFHEACGHQLESKFVTSNISQYADKKEQLVASELVTLLDNGLDKDAIGYSKYDDEGNKQSKRLLIKKGVLKGFLIDDIDAEKLNTKSNGSGRTQSYNLDPVSRMTNTYIENGKNTFDEIISTIKLGIYAKSLSGGQVNPISGQFNFGISEAYLIKDGKIQELIKPIAIIGNGLEVIKRISMIGNDFE
jgi:TldD protein